MESSYHLYVNPSDDDELTQYIPQDAPSGDYFYINFNYIHHVIMSSDTHHSNPTYDDVTTIDHRFLVPRQVLCDCNEVTVLDRDNTDFMHEAFSSLPICPELLDAMLPYIGEGAREIIAQNDEGRNTWKMDVRLYILTRLYEDNDDSDEAEYAFLASLITDSLEKAIVTDYSTEQCAICLEEFCNGSNLELVSTKCFHVFHKECVAQWIQSCICRESSYTCPLCRGQIC